MLTDHTTVQTSENLWLKAAKVLWVVTAFLAKHTFKIVLALLSILGALIAAKLMAEDEGEEINPVDPATGEYVGVYTDGFGGNGHWGGKTKNPF
jgi:hypothetical protein